MRSEAELIVEFKRGEDNSPQYWRDRIILEVLLDIRSLMRTVAEKL